MRWFSNYSSEKLIHKSHTCTHPFSNISTVVISPGLCWCQVLDYTDGGDGHLLGRSNVVEVLSWERYSSLLMWKGVQSVWERKCGDLSPSPTSSNINSSPMCFLSTTEMQTTTISGEHLCVLYVCCAFINKLMVH